MRVLAGNAARRSHAAGTTQAVGDSNHRRRLAPPTAWHGAPRASPRLAPPARRPQPSARAAPKASVDPSMRRARCSSVGVAGSAVLGKGQPSTAPAIALKQLAFYRLAPVPLTGSRTPFTIGAQQRLLLQTRYLAAAPPRPPAGCSGAGSGEKSTGYVTVTTPPFLGGLKRKLKSDSRTQRSNSGSPRVVPSISSTDSTIPPTDASRRFVKAKTTLPLAVGLAFSRLP